MDNRHTVLISVWGGGGGGRNDDDDDDDLAYTGPEGTEDKEAAK